MCFSCKRTNVKRKIKSILFYDTLLTETHVLTEFTILVCRNYKLIHLDCTKIFKRQMYISLYTIIHFKYVVRYMRIDLYSIHNNSIRILIIVKELITNCLCPTVAMSPLIRFSRFIQITVSFTKKYKFSYFTLAKIMLNKIYEFITNFISYWYFRYLLVTELYMVEKWERTMFRILLE